MQCISQVYLIKVQRFVGSHGKNVQIAWTKTLGRNIFKFKYNIHLCYTTIHSITEQLKDLQIIKYIIYYLPTVICRCSRMKWNKPTEKWHAQKSALVVVHATYLVYRLQISQTILWCHACSLQYLKCRGGFLFGRLFGWWIILKQF